MYSKSSVFAEDTDFFLNCRIIPTTPQCILVTHTSSLSQFWAYYWYFPLKGNPFSWKELFPIFYYELRSYRITWLRIHTFQKQITKISQQRFTKGSRVLPTYIIQRQKSVSFQSPHHLPFLLIFSELSVTKIFLIRTSVLAIKSLDLSKSFRERQTLLRSPFIMYRVLYKEIKTKICLKPGLSLYKSFNTHTDKDKPATAVNSYDNTAHLGLFQAHLIQQ